MNAVEMLMEHHREVESLFSRFERARRPPEKQEIFEQLAARLVAHDAIEREIFYPACERALGKLEPLMEGIAEHGLMEFSIFRADQARGKETFDYLVKTLKEIVEHHVEEEEREILPRAQKKLGADMLERLGDEMAQRYEEAMGADFRMPLRRNLQQVIGGRTKTTPAKRTAARAGGKRRAASTSTRARAGTPRKGTKKRGARGKQRSSRA